MLNSRFSVYLLEDFYFYFMKYFLFFILLMYKTAVAIPPTVVQLTPTNNALNQLPGVNLTINFSQNILKDTGIIQVYNGTTNMLISSFAVTQPYVTVNLSQVVIDLPVNLPLFSQIYVLIDNMCFKNAGNEFFAGFTSPTNWGFSTTNEVLNAVSFSPLSGCITSNNQLSVSFNKNTQQSTGKISVFNANNTLHEDILATSANISGWGTATLNVSLTNLLVSNSGYYVLIEQNFALSALGGAFSGILANNIWTFQTAVLPPNTQGQSLCGANTFTLNANSSQKQPYEYRWYTLQTGGTPILNNLSQPFNTNIFTTNTLSTTTIFYVSTINASCESARVPVTATVRDFATIGLTTNKMTVQKGERAQLTATGGLLYRWLPTNGLSDATSATPFATPDVTTTYTVFVRNPQNCENSAQITINVQGIRTEFYLPTLFSPNNDSNNDRFRVMGKNIQTIDFRVMDKEGRILYQTNDVQEAQNNGWNGTFSGAAMPPDAYVWYLSGTYQDGAPLIKDNKHTGIIVLTR